MTPVIILRGSLFFFTPTAIPSAFSSSDKLATYVPLSGRLTAHNTLADPSQITTGGWTRSPVSLSATDLPLYQESLCIYWLSSQYRPTSHWCTGGLTDRILVADRFRPRCADWPFTGQSLNNGFTLIVWALLSSLDEWPPLCRTADYIYYCIWSRGQMTASL